MSKDELKKKAIELRKKGYSYNLIKKEVPVAKSTLSLWLRDIPFKPNDKVKNRIIRNIERASEWARNNKKKSINKAKEQAEEKLGRLSERDLLMLGLGLYIGEGSKSQDMIEIANSDPRVICLAMRWLEDCFGLHRDNFSLMIHLYPDNDIEKSLNFWSNVTGIPISQFHKTQIDNRQNKKIKKGKLRHGTANLRVKANGNKDFGVLLFRKIIFMINEAYNQID